MAQTPLPPLRPWRQRGSVWLSPVWILLLSLYLMPRHSLTISPGAHHCVQPYLKLELNQIQQSRVGILGIIGMCAGIAYPRQILGNQPKSINTGREIAGYQSTIAAIHMHEAHRPDSLVESGPAIRGTNFRDTAVPFPQQRPCKPQSPLSRICCNQGNLLG